MNALLHDAVHEELPDPPIPVIMHPVYTKQATHDFQLQREDLMSDRKQIAIIGAGHNALVCACYLAKAGHDVVVYERRSSVGGAVNDIAANSKA